MTIRNSDNTRHAFFKRFLRIVHGLWSSTYSWTICHFRCKKVTSDTLWFRRFLSEFQCRWNYWQNLREWTFLRAISLHIS